jgi:hypothetical protein
LKKERPTKLSQIFNEPSETARDKDGRFFIDFDGDVFVHVLNYLRHGSIPPKEKISEVYECAKYFGINTMVDALKLYSPIVCMNAIIEMKKSFDKEQYELIKYYCVKELTEKFHSKADKYLMFDTLPNNCPVIRPNAGNMFAHSVNKSCYVPQCSNVQISYPNIYKDLFLPKIQTCPELMKCLGYDLCELGFGNISYFTDGGQVRCTYCQYITVNIIILRQKRLQGDCYPCWNS